MQKIKLGKITAPVGIKGEVRVYPYLDQTRFSDYRQVCFENGEAVVVEKIRADKNLLVIKLSCSANRNDAEGLRGRELYLPEGKKPDLGEDNYLVDELIGMTVKDASEAVIGILEGVISRSIQDLYEIEMPDGKTFLLPAVKEFILDVDTEGNVMTVNLPEGITKL